VRKHLTNVQRETAGVVLRGERMFNDAQAERNIETHRKLKARHLGIYHTEQIGFSRGHTINNTHNSSISSDERLALETSASLIFHDGNSTLLTRLIKPNFRKQITCQGGCNISLCPRLSLIRPRDLKPMTVSF